MARPSEPTAGSPLVDIEQLFPELRAYAATATRLHPHPGQPGPDDSSIGGPLRWPADESWPYCTGREHYVDRLLTPETVRRMRRVYAAATSRAAATGQPYRLTDAEDADVPEFDYTEPVSLAKMPIALVPVAQLYRHDVADLTGPPDADLLQVLWCPLDHPDNGYSPWAELRWRRTADLGEQLTTAPEPAVVNENYLPTPCLVRPEQVREYQYVGLLPENLKKQLYAWEKQSGHSYQADLSLAPGWKIGGFANWSLSDWHPVDCTECGAAMTLLLTASSDEQNGSARWRTAADPAGNPVDVLIGRGYSLHVFACPTSPTHPPATVMQ
ncbi:hypothetical protein [Micromonospora sp. LOL_021]|uniref:hypothetical protein n=1 Tax=Micromonospora sp. LOL_021 TaxID=3345417 RepID=UPI003A86ABF5